MNSNIGWVGGDFGTILKITTRGNNWDFVQLDTLDNIYSIFFVDSLNGWAVFFGYVPERYGGIIHTTYGGINWEVQYSISGVMLHDVFFIDR